MKSFSATLALMPRFECSICSAPPDVLQAVNNALLAGESGRKIAARSAFSKSALYRHRDKCLPKSIVSRHRDRMMAAAKRGRIIVCFEKDDEPADLGPNDTVIAVRYEECPLEQITNPGALITEDLLSEAIAEHRERFPAAVFASEVEAQRQHASTEQFANQTPASENQADNVNLNSPAQPAPSECQHVMVRVSGDISRCQQCGFQAQPPAVFGVSRDWLKQKRSRFGRFG